MNAAAHPSPPPAAPLDVRDAPALQACADRLERHRRRMADDRDAARLRLRSNEHERPARRQLRPEQIRALADAGILVPTAGDLDERRTIDRRRHQLDAIAELQRITADSLDRPRPPDSRSAEQAEWMA